MSYIIVAPGTTWCPDTPANRREFEQLKARMKAMPGGTKMQQQVAKENKWLKTFNGFLPGHGPNRF